MNPKTLDFSLLSEFSVGTSILNGLNRGVRLGIGVQAPIKTMPSDFPVTRETLERLDDWVMELASPLLPLKSVRVELEHLTGFVWEFREESERALLIGKAVRMVSGIKVAMMLADLGHISECGILLRSVSDFASEIICICDGIKAGVRTRAHRDFVDQYFTKLPKTPTELEEQPRVDFVSRDKLWAALYRWAMENKVDQTRVRLVMRFLGNMYDKFVHGGYITATELYDPSSWTFMLRGHKYQAKIEEYQRATASKLHQSVTALASIAEHENNHRLVDEICRAGLRLHACGELQGS